jgi:hypothetical protein
LKRRSGLQGMHIQKIHMPRVLIDSNRLKRLLFNSPSILRGESAWIFCASGPGSVGVKLLTTDRKYSI